LGVPFEERGTLLDEHLEAWRLLWRNTPASFEGRHYRFHDVYLEPKPSRPQGPTMWFGGSTLHPRLLRRLVTYGGGFDPLGAPTADDLDRLRAAMADAGRDMGELEMVGGTRGTFPDANSTADLGEALASIPGQVARGFTSICIKPSQFIDDPSRIGDFCREVVERVAAVGT
ncbi:MAG: LLM class flavin-dependent oxidoreductase, partial [Actinomycetota bacterium]